MTVVSVAQDVLGGGGNSTVVEWYRRWAALHEPHAVHCALDEGTNGWPLRARREWGTGEVRIPRAMPVLHVPPYLVGRRHLRKLWGDIDEVHVVGAVGIHGWIADSRIPMTVWFATTIEDERRSVMKFMDRRRRMLYVSTLPALRRIETSVLGHARRVLVMSGHTGDILIRGGLDSSRIEVLPVPIDTRRFSAPAHSQRQGLLFLGRARDPRKGLDRAVALVRCSRSAGEVGLDVVSRQEPSPKFQQLDGLLRWRGDVADAAMAYRRAQVFLMPSRQEGFGIAAFEALACGTPVVAYRSGGPDALLAESGGAVLVDNLEDFVRSTERLLADEFTREQMGAQGRAWVEQHLSSDPFLADPTMFRP